MSASLLPPSEFGLESLPRGHGLRFNVYYVCRKRHQVWISEARAELSFDNGALDLHRFVDDVRHLQEKAAIGELGWVRKLLTIDVDQHV